MEDDEEEGRKAEVAEASGFGRVRRMRIVRHTAQPLRWSHEHGVQSIAVLQCACKCAVCLKF